MLPSTCNTSAAKNDNNLVDKLAALWNVPSTTTLRKTTYVSPPSTSAKINASVWQELTTSHKSYSQQNFRKTLIHYGPCSPEASSNSVGLFGINL
ncbi:hypothetical protein EG68_12019 [Paragonimus skrjabini miyazakii]|uniref:Uncharacterized protein n=1 Tax=Paragonimus skrjabini miyazakii TaxID=59628 RepID=A0A8S9YDL2_9TREM|nr:hypothetical protein EG68_12019 [Paragonimus skrjabini miyazakii]